MSLPDVHKRQIMSITPAQRAEACLSAYIWAPPQLGVPKPALRFGFTARCIRAHRQGARPDPACRAKSVIIDRERFTHARRSCLEPRPFRWKRTRRRTVSLWRTRVPKPTSTYSFRVIRKWKGEAAFLPRLNPWVSCRRDRHEQR
jgi:hypothetical protein